MMMIKAACFIFAFALFSLTSCSEDNDTTTADPVTDTPVDPAPETPTTENPPTDTTTTTPLKYMALGDSYTIGQNVCATCRFPIQLKDSLELHFTQTTVQTDIIAQTGWTTSNLISAIASQNPAHDYDLVTLLIGVNNQYQHKPFSLYEQEFPQLVATAISLGKGDKANVIVVSIPDYAYTPFGVGSQNQAMISAEIDQYNAFAQNYCTTNDIKFVNITDITRFGLQQPSLVTTDGLHPSEIAYSQFIGRILPEALLTLP